MNTIANQIYHKYLKPEKFEGEMKNASDLYHSLGA